MEELRTNAKKLTQSEQYLLRKNIIRLLKKGQAPDEIAQTLDVSRSHVYATKKAYDESVRVRFKANRKLIGDVLDWFGRDVALPDAGGDKMLVSVKVNEQAMFYWAMQYGNSVEVLEPNELREKVFNAAVAMAEKYK